MLIISAYRKEKPHQYSVSPPSKKNKQSHTWIEADDDPVSDACQEKNKEVDLNSADEDDTNAEPDAEIIQCGLTTLHGERRLRLSNVGRDMREHIPMVDRDAGVDTDSEEELSHPKICSAPAPELAYWGALDGRLVKSQGNSRSHQHTVLTSNDSPFCLESHKTGSMSPNSLSEGSDGDIEGEEEVDPSQIM